MSQPTRKSLVIKLDRHASRIPQALPKHPSLLRLLAFLTAAVQGKAQDPTDDSLTVGQVLKVSKIELFVPSSVDCQRANPALTGIADRDSDPNRTVVYSSQSPVTGIGDESKVLMVTQLLELLHGLTDSFLLRLGATSVASRVWTTIVSHADSHNHVILFAPNDHVLRIDSQIGSLHGIPRLIRLDQPGHRLPTADIIPSERCLDDGYIVVAFHHRKVDRFPFDSLKVLFKDLWESRSADASGDLIDLFINGRFELADRFKNRLGFPQKIPLFQ